MLELKLYQTRVLDELRTFLTELILLPPSRHRIQYAYMSQTPEEAGRYKPIPGLEQVPFICIKVPTGGGKTLLASYSINELSENYILDKNGKGLVMWFVPSDAIRTQTIEALKNKNHPYRELLDAKFDNKIKISLRRL